MCLSTGDHPCHGVAVSSVTCKLNLTVHTVWLSSFWTPTLLFLEITHSRKQHNTILLHENRSLVLTCPALFGQVHWRKKNMPSPHPHPCFWSMPPNIQAKHFSPPLRSTFETRNNPEIGFQNLVEEYNPSPPSKSVQVPHPVLFLTAADSQRQWGVVLFRKDHSHGGWKKLSLGWGKAEVLLIGS